MSQIIPTYALQLLSAFWPDSRHLLEKVQQSVISKAKGNLPVYYNSQLGILVRAGLLVRQWTYTM